MPVHLHTTLSPKTDKILTELARTYGTKSLVLTKALETFLRVEKVGSCDDCPIKTRIVEESNLKEALSLTSISQKALNGLLEVAIGDKSFEDFIKDQQTEAHNITIILKDSIGWKSPTSFKEFLLFLEKIKDLTQLFDITSYNEIEKNVVLKTNVFSKMPEIVAMHVATILKGAKATFDFRIMGENIIVKMIGTELFRLGKKDFEVVLSQQIKNRFDKIKPAFFKDNLVLVGPGFLSWAQKHLEEPVTDMGAIIEDVGTVLGKSELPREPKDFMNALVFAGIKMNWFRQAKVIEKEENVLRLVFHAISPEVAKIAVSAFSVMLATRGWKLLNYSLEHTNGIMELKFAGTGDQSLLDQLLELNVYKTIVRQFLDFIPVSRNTFNSFASKVFETDKKRFEDAYTDVGKQIANAIKMLVWNDLERVRRLAGEFIAKNVNMLQNDAEVRFIDRENFTIIFKRIDPLLINSQQLLIAGMYKELGYEVESTVLQNVLSFKIQQVLKPILEPIPRQIMMENLIDVISANNAMEAFSLVKDQIDKIFPKEYPWTIREVGKRLRNTYRKLDIQVEIEYFEGGFTLKYETCPYYKLVKSGQKTWLCEFRRKKIEYIISRVVLGKKGKIKMIKSLLRNEHPCEYAVFLTEFLK